MSAQLVAAIQDLHRRVSELEATNKELAASNSALAYCVHHHESEIQRLKDIISPQVYSMRPYDLDQAVAEMEASDPVQQFLNGALSP